MKNVWWKCLAVCLWAAVMAGCVGSPSRQKGISADTPLRIGVAPDYPPVIFKQDGVIAGMEADLAVNVARALNRPYRFVSLDWNQMIPALMEGRIDIIMAGMTVTEERAIRVAFSKPYLKTGQMALIRRTDAARYSQPAQVMMGRANVGFQRGTTGEQFVRQQFPNAKEIGFLSAEDAAIALNRGRIDLLIHDAPVVWWLASENEAKLMVSPQPLTEEYLAWAVRRDDPELLALVNDCLDAMKKDGTLNRIFKRWMPGAP